MMQAALYTASIDDAPAGSTNSGAVWSQLVGSSFRSLGHLLHVILCHSSLQRVAEEQEPTCRSNPPQSCSLQHFSTFLFKRFWDSAIAQMISWESRQRQVPPEVFSVDPNITMVAFECSVLQNYPT